MDVSKVTYEEFADKLEKKSIKDLYALARNSNISLPSGLDTKEIVLSALYCAFKNSDPSAEAKASPPAPSSGAQPASADGPRIVVLATHGPRHYRCGRKFTSEWSKPIFESEFTLEQLDTLRADPHLKVKPYKEPPAPPAPSS